MGNDVPDVTCTALRCVLRLGMARPGDAIWPSP